MISTIIDNATIANANKGAKVPSSYTFTTDVYPGATTTWFYGINDMSNSRFINGSGTNGQIVGAFCCTGTNQAWHGFLFDGISTWTAIEYPNEVSGGAFGINNAGQIVGTWTDSAHCSHGYLYSAGTYTSYDNPNAVCAQGGTGFTDKRCRPDFRSVLHQHGMAEFLVLQPNVLPPRLSREHVHERVGSKRGWNDLWRNVGSTGLALFTETPIPTSWTGSYVSFFDPAGVATFGRGINNKGDVAGYYEISYQNDVGLVWTNDVQLVSFQYPPNYDTYATGVNDFGQVVGYYGGHAFVATPQ